MARRKNTTKDIEIEEVKEKEAVEFDVAIDSFLKDQKIKNRTPRTIEWHLENFHVLKKAFKAQQIPLDIRTIDSKQLKHNFILYSMEVYGNQASTINNRLKTFRSFWGFLKKEGYVKIDITKGIDSLKEKKKVIITLNEEEIKAMFSACNEQTFTGLRDLTFLKTLLDTGARLDELVKLTVEDIFWQDDQIKLDGKGQKERMVPMSNKLKKTLRKYIDERGNVAAKEVFVTLDNNPINKITIQERIKKLAIKTHIKKKCSPHIWRHTFAKFYIINGGDPFSLKKILGHSSWEMVHRYVDMFAPELRKQHRKYSPLNEF